MVNLQLMLFIFQEYRGYSERAQILQSTGYWVLIVNFYVYECICKNIHKMIKMVC